MAYYVANGMGDSIDSPSPEQMRSFLENIDPNDEEHGAAWLETGDGYVLEWSGDGRLVLSEPAHSGVRHVANVSREQTIELWRALARGDLEYVNRQAWREGSGYIEKPGRRAELQRWQLEQDREFYDALGSERGASTCRREGCNRGPVADSVLCRVHHFESITGRRSPFSH